MLAAHAIGRAVAGFSRSWAPSVWTTRFSFLISSWCYEVPSGCHLVCGEKKTKRIIVLSVILKCFFNDSLRLFNLDFSHENWNMEPSSQIKIFCRQRSQSMGPSKIFWWYSDNWNFIGPVGKLNFKMQYEVVMSLIRILLVLAVKWGSIISLN